MKKVPAVGKNEVERGWVVGFKLNSHFTSSSGLCWAENERRHNSSRETSACDNAFLSLH
jgi:hypothetical protein